MSRDTLADIPDARDVSDDVTVNECQAMRHLSADGWSEAELQMALERSNDAVRTHLSGACGHPDVADPTPRPIPTPDELHARRAAANLSLTEFADAVGVTPASVVKWESGDTTPKRDRVPTIQNVLEEHTDD